MSDKNIKVLRKQLRDIVKEALPEVVTVELVKAGHEQLKKEVEARLDAIDKYIKEALKVMEDRSKDTASYLLRNVSPSQKNDK